MRYHISLQILKSKYLLYLLIIRILLSDPFRMLLGYLEPHPISKVGIEESTGMETITSLDHFTWLTIVEVHTFENILSWEVVID